MSEPSFPLHWPLSRALDELERELHLLGGKHHVISTNVQTRLDGMPYANRARPNDPGVAVYFTLKEKRVVLACDKWTRPECNLWAIVKHIEALRGQQRWGVGSVEQAFAGYAALAERTQASCWEVLGVSPDASEAQILAAYREKARTTHPDAGGTTEAFTAVCQAKDIALATRRNAA